MAKKATSKDYQTYSNWQEAQNLSSYGSRGVPNRPVATGGKKTVPEVLDWGKGIPKDYLAYLNKQEMALVQNARKFKGKRNYKGIPAYPDPGDTAAGDTGQGTSSSAGLGNNTSPGGYHSTDTRYGNSTGNSTAGAGTGGGSDSGGNIGGGIGGLGGGSSANNGVGSERASETSGATTATGTTNADSSAMQSAAESDAATVSISSPALRRDAASGGINSIGIGPENNRINITNPSESSISGAIARSASAYKDVTPTSPGGGGMGQMNVRRGSETVAVGPTSGKSALGNIDRGSVYGTDPGWAATEDEIQGTIDKHNLNKAYADNERWRNYKDPSIPGRAAEADKNYRIEAAPGIGGGAAVRVYSDPDIPREPTTGEVISNYISSGVKALSDYWSPEAPVEAGSSYAKINKIATDVPKIIYDRVPQYSGPISDLNPVETDPYAEVNAKIALKDLENRYRAFDQSIKPGEERIISIENVPENTAPLDESGNPYGPETPSVDTVDGVNPMQDNSGPLPPGVSPYQDEAVYPEKTPAETYITDHLPYVKYATKMARYLGQKEFEHLTPEERNALAAKWVEEQDAYMKGSIAGQAGKGQGGQDSGSRVGILALEAQDRMRRNQEAAAAAAAANEANNEEDNTPKTDRERYDYGPLAGGRPAKYYQWDLGMRIPKLGDPDYNEYRYYLRQRRVNYA